MGPGPCQTNSPLAHRREQRCNQVVSYPLTPSYKRILCAASILLCSVHLTGCGVPNVGLHQPEQEVRQYKKSIFRPYIPPKDSIDWVHSLDHARQVARQRGVPLMVYVATKWCGPCKHLKATTFRHSAVINMVNTRFVAVELDGDTPIGRQYCRGRRITSYPTLVFDSWVGVEIDRAFGYRSAKRFISMLGNMLADRNTVGDYRRRLTKDPGNTSIMLQYGQHLALRGDIELAKSILNRAADHTDKPGISAQALFTLARYVYELKVRDLRQAQRTYQELISRFPESTVADTARLRMATIAAGNGNKTKALELLTVIADRQPLHSARLLRACIIGQRLGLPPASLVQWAKAACTLRRDGQPWFVLSTLYHQLGQRALRLKALARAVRLSPKNGMYRRAYQQAQ